MSREATRQGALAPPKVLGDLRRKSAKATEARIIAEIAKDLTNHTIAEIERLLTAEQDQR